MPDLMLEGSTLGQKHRHYNNLVKDAIVKNETEVAMNDADIKELIRIDIAAHNKDLDKILTTLQCDNLLYVSRALKKCKWLATDDKYADVINPERLKNNLFPLMSMKARTQLLNFIRKNIIDEARAEQFFKFENNIHKSLKWLPKCSIAFIENIFTDNQYYSNISSDLLKKLCERSATVLKIAIDKEYLSEDKIKAISFLRKNNVDIYLNALDKTRDYVRIKLDSKTTNVIMKHCPKNIIENFDRYARSIHIPTFAKYLKKEDIKPLLYKQARLFAEQRYSYRSKPLFCYDNLKHLIKVLPKAEQFIFVKKVFIDKTLKSNENSSADPEIEEMKKLCEVYYGNHYDWYQMAPFDVAFSELQMLISTATLENKYTLLTILIKCAQNNQQNLQSVLRFYRDKHSNDSIKLKTKFIDKLLGHTKFSRYVDDTWSILDDIVKSINVYKSTENNVPQKFTETLIVYYLMKGIKIPEILQNRFEFNTLSKYKHGINNDEQKRIFDYIYNYAVKRVPNVQNIQNIEEYKSAVVYLRDALLLLKEWNKCIVDYPVIMTIIKGYVKLDIQNGWKTDLSLLYDVNKYWRKYMFEESLHLKQSEEVAINALKHDVGLLERYNDRIEGMCLKHKSPLKRFLRKIRLFWSQTIAKDWMDKYFMRFEDVNTLSNNAARNIFTLMPPSQVLDLINKYSPSEGRIDWDTADPRVVSFQKFIAKNMHFAQPHVMPDSILPYAKGDYLQYAIPSVLAIFYNLNLTQSRQYIPKLLDAPVSLQKHGIRLAITNLEHKDLMDIFYKVWTNSKNLTIRVTLFKLTYKLLCKENCDKKIDDLWELLKMFIGVLSFQEDKKVYELLYDIRDIPSKVKPQYIEASYTFLESFLPHSGVDKDNVAWNMINILEASKETMEAMSENFMLRVINKYFEAIIKMEQFDAGKDRIFLSVTSIFLLCAKDEQVQASKYRNILHPLLQQLVEVEKLQPLFVNLSNDRNYVVQNNMVIPVKMFSDINDELVKKLNVLEHFELLKMWKITLEWAQIMQKSLSNGRKYPEDWKLEDAEEPLELGKKVVEILKATDDFPCIYLLYDKLLYNIFDNIEDKAIEMKVYKSMLYDSDFIPIHLAIARQASYSQHKDWKEVLEILNNHPSLEVKMHVSFNKKRHW